MVGELLIGLLQSLKECIQNSQLIINTKFNVYLLLVFHLIIKQKAMLIKLIYIFLSLSSTFSCIHPHLVLWNKIKFWIILHDWNFALLHLFYPDIVLSLRTKPFPITYIQFCVSVCVKSTSQMSIYFL